LKHQTTYITVIHQHACREIRHSDESIILIKLPLVWSSMTAFVSQAYQTVTDIGDSL